MHTIKREQSISGSRLDKPSIERPALCISWETPLSYQGALTKQAAPLDSLPDDLNHPGWVKKVIQKFWALPRDRAHFYSFYFISITDYIRSRSRLWASWLFDLIHQMILLMAWCDSWRIFIRVWATSQVQWDGNWSPISRWRVHSNDSSWAFQTFAAHGTRCARVFYKVYLAPKSKLRAGQPACCICSMFHRLGQKVSRRMSIIPVENISEHYWHWVGEICPPGVNCGDDGL